MDTFYLTNLEQMVDSVGLGCPHAEIAGEMSPELLRYHMLRQTLKEKVAPTFAKEIVCSIEPIHFGTRLSNGANSDAARGLPASDYRMMTWHW
jgi:hypothetical protein